MGTKYSDLAPFYVTLQINDSLLHNCVFDPDSPRNIMTERVMHQVGLNISQPNTQDGFTRGIIKDLGVFFHAFSNVSFKIDVIVIETLSSFTLQILGRKTSQKLPRPRIQSYYTPSRRRIFYPSQGTHHRMPH